MVLQMFHAVPPDLTNSQRVRTAETSVCHVLRRYRSQRLNFNARPTQENELSSTLKEPVRQLDLRTHAVPTWMQSAKSLLRLAVIRRFGKDEPLKQTTS